MALLVHALACAFGLGSWAAVNGVWAELPVMVNVLPEGWELPAYLTVIIQLANLGPLLVTLLHKLRPGGLQERPVIYFVLSVGVASCVLLAFFWDETTVVAGARRSTAFFVITFFLALVDCTSSVTFLPFVARLPAEYVTTYFVGEGLSGLIPGVVALAQGAGMAQCVAGNQTGANATAQTAYLPPTFSTEVFFSLLAVMMCVSLAAFVALARLPVSHSSAENLVPAAAASVDSGLDGPNPQLKGRAAGLTAHRLAFIYPAVVWVNAATNGLLPAVQTYSCKPYGNLAYHLAAVLPLVANPAACTLAMFLPNRSLLFLGALMALGTGFGGYNMAMAAMSPCPLLQGSAAGEAIIVASWLLFTGAMTYVKVMVGVILRDHSHSALVWCGAASQLGSLVGSLTMFPLVSIYRLFQSGDICNTSCPV